MSWWDGLLFGPKVWLPDAEMPWEVRTRSRVIDWDDLCDLARQIDDYAFEVRDLYNAEDQSIGNCSLTSIYASRPARLGWPVSPDQFSDRALQGLVLEHDALRLRVHLHTGRPPAVQGPIGPGPVPSAVAQMLNAYGRPRFWWHRWIPLSMRRRWSADRAPGMKVQAQDRATTRADRRARRSALRTTLIVSPVSSLIGVVIGVAVGR